MKLFNLLATDIQKGFVFREGKTVVLMVDVESTLSKGTTIKNYDLVYNNSKTVS